MTLTVGDKCPQCREGLLERTELGLSCSECSFDMDIAEVVEANQKSRTEVESQGYKWKPRTFKITIEDPDEAEDFLRGLILAKQNNNSQFFPDLIDAVNAILEPWRKAQLLDQVQKRGG